LAYELIRAAAQAARARAQFGAGQIPAPTMITLKEAQQRFVSAARQELAV
jgi:hypothetical protein